MSEPNYAGNIIVNLASLPDFLRKPILKKRMIEFFSMSSPEKIEVINNALEAGPTIPFANFSKLFKTWLEILTSLDGQQRRELFEAYINEILKSPQKLIMFNLDGIFEIFLTLDKDKRKIIAETIKTIILDLTPDNKKKIFLLIPNAARESIGV